MVYTYILSDSQIWAGIYSVIRCFLVTDGECFLFGFIGQQHSGVATPILSDF